MLYSWCDTGGCSSFTNASPSYLTQRFWILIHQSKGYIYIYIYIYIYHHHYNHHHVTPPARISLTLSATHPKVFKVTFSIDTQLFYIGFSWSCCLWSSCLWSSIWRGPQQSPACLVRLTWIVFVMCDRWPYSSCFVGCCHQDWFSIAHSILV